VTAPTAVYPCPRNDGGHLEDDSYLFPKGKGCDVCGREFRLVDTTWTEVPPTSAVYLWCPSCLDGRSEVDPSNPDLPMECEACGHEWEPGLLSVELVLGARGYVFTPNHGWRTEAEMREDAVGCDSCRYGGHR